MFEKASRIKLRFDTALGSLGTEDLWDLPLVSNTGKVCLDAIAVELFGQMTKSDVVSFVNKDQKTNELLKLRFDVVKRIIDVRLAEREEAKQHEVNADKKQQILAIITQKENEALAGSSLDELKVLAASL